MPATKRSSCNPEFLKDAEALSSPKSPTYTTYHKLMKTSNESDFKMSEYINLVSGMSRQVENVGQLDHTYARASCWQSFNHYMQPCRYLYSSLPRKSVYVSSDGSIDPDLQDMELSLLRLDKVLPISDESDSDREEMAMETCHWVETIPKIGWSPVQIRILPKVVQLMEEVLLARQTIKGSLSNKYILIENAMLGFSTRLSNHLASASWDKDVTRWLHALLMKRLTPKQKKYYLTLLALIRERSPALVARMVSPPDYAGRPSFGKDVAHQQCPSTVLPKSVNHVKELLLNEKFRKLPCDPVFLLIPNSVETETSERYTTFVTQLKQMANVATVHFPPLGKSSIMQYLDQMMGTVRVKLSEIASEFSGRPVILVGWTLGAALACLAAQLDPVAAVVCLGFPLTTMDSPGFPPARSVLDINCPLLLVIGSKSSHASQEDVEEMRLHMKAPNHLIVLGSCNNQLVMNRREMSKFGVTQTMVDRSLVVEIYNFVGDLLTKPRFPSPRRNRLPFVPETTHCFLPPSKRPSVSKVATQKKLIKPMTVAKELPKGAIIVNGTNKNHIAINQTSLVSKRKPRNSQTDRQNFNPTTCSVLLTHNYAAHL